MNITKEEFAQFVKRQQEKNINHILLCDYAQLIIGALSFDIQSPPKEEIINFARKIASSKSISDTSLHIALVIEDALTTLESSYELNDSFFHGFIDFAFKDMSEIKPEQSQYYIPFLAIYSMRVGNISRVIELVKKLGQYSKDDQRFSGMRNFNFQPIIEQLISSNDFELDDNLINLLAEFYQEGDKHMKHHIIYLLMIRSYDIIYSVDENQRIKFLNKLITINSFANEFRRALNVRNEWKSKIIALIICEGELQFLLALLDNELICSTDFHFFINFDEDLFDEMRDESSLLSLEPENIKYNLFDQ